MMGYSLPSAAYVVSESQHQRNGAAYLFSSALAAGRLRQLWAAITRRPSVLRGLEAEHVPGKGGHYAGLKQVAIDDIWGSEGRQGDFDDRFNPLSDRTRQRWQSVASSIAAGISLPPVDLIQVGNHYYVRDGHHRVSVTRALGEHEIEAKVTVWTTD
jgi:hypothetical protein